MDETLDAIESQLPRKRNFDSPPLHLWHPPLSGDIDIRITPDGNWYHNGGLIKREALVRLFASILRREDDGHYYLVTPGEKWRIQVELHPLLVTDVEEGGDGLLHATLNTGKQVPIDAEHPLFLEPKVGDIAALTLDHGLTALFTRAAWYRLVEMGSEISDEPPVISSGDYSFILAAD